MKVAVLSNFKSGTGYGNAAISYMLSLDSVGVTVVPRSVYMTDSKGEVPARISELEQNDLHGVDAVIQFNLPSEFVSKKDILNIGAFCYETSTLKYTRWAQKLADLDMCIVPCMFQKEILDKEIPNLLSHVIPYAVDIDKYNCLYPKHLDIPDTTHKFYTISEMVPRKELMAMVVAYLSEFTSNDDVVLVIKTHLPNHNADEARKMLKTNIKNIKDSLKLHHNEAYYPKIIVCTDYLTDKQLMSIHSQCNTFVSSSRGESMCMPAIDAMCFGNKVIVPNNTCFLDYPDQMAIKCESVPSIVFNSNNIYTARERWNTVSTAAIADAMRMRYNEGFTKNKIDINPLSYKSIGNLLLKAIQYNAN